jgi:hypothetical protein
MVVATILVLALSMMLSTLSGVGKLEPTNRETEGAQIAAANTLEFLRATPFDQCFALYNADPADDPAGAGTAPGASFAVPGLTARPGDPDGFVGEIVFPEIGAALREDVANRDLGMPRDLNGDGVIDNADHAGDYAILPVRIRLQWTGRNGLRTLELDSMLVENGA